MRGGFLIRYLSEHKNIRSRKVILVAPWLDTEKYLNTLTPGTDFFDFKIDPELSQRTHIDIIYSTDDEKEILQSVEEIKKNIPDIQEYVFSGKGHFTEPDMGTKEFPELVKIIVG